MELTVTGCKDCPFISKDYYVCLHPKVYTDPIHIDTDEGWELITPPNCPLKEEDITISIQKQINL